VLFSDGSLWREQRRFSLRHLRDFGFGKRSLEGLIFEEIEVMLQQITERAKSEDNAKLGISVQDLFPVSVINVLWAIMAGIR
jgi:methyl farnesoate epoxidase/farnesoate epoxidase